MSLLDYLSGFQAVQTLTMFMLGGCGLVFIVGHAIRRNLQAQADRELEALRVKDEIADNELERKTRWHGVTNPSPLLPGRAEDVKAGIDNPDEQ